MHQLYLHYLGCKAKWSNCSLIMVAKKRVANDEVERYEYWTYTRMVEELGADLADDLVARRKVAESKLPGHKKGKFIKKPLGVNLVSSP